MKNTFILLILLSISLFPFILNSKNNDKAKSEIIEVLLKQEEDWNRGDIEGYMNAYLNSDSLLFIGKSGPKFGWKTTYENYKMNYPNKSTMGALKFTFLKIEMINNKSAIVIGKWELNRENDSPSGYFSLLMKKIKNQWKITFDHSS